MLSESYPAFPKIPRLRRTIVVTEKIDGTNALVAVSNDLSTVRAGSRNRWITPEQDNYGFAAWVHDNEEELKKLGPGLHYGEWWGSGIQRRYDIMTKRFSLFNTARWTDDAVRPACCHVVPVLGIHDNNDGLIEAALTRLRTEGSVAAPGWMNPEGVVVFHTASGTLGKIILENDSQPKGT